MCLLAASAFPLSRKSREETFLPEAGESERIVKINPSRFQKKKKSGKKTQKGSDSVPIYPTLVSEG